MLLEALGMSPWPPIPANRSCLLMASFVHAATAVAASSAEKHAVVLGLKAFVLCTPYDVPAWLPEVLMVLTQAASQPAPIKVTVRWGDCSHLTFV